MTDIIAVDFSEMVSEDFPELLCSYDVMLGRVREKFESKEVAREAFRRTMRKRGYTLDAGRVWLKPGWTAVMQPK